MKISFIIVNYNSEDFLRKCLESLRQNITNEAYEVIVVNNDPVDLKKEDWNSFPNLQIINRTANDGFAKACNAGSRIANGEFLFFLNPDTELKSSTISELLTALGEPSVGIVAPKLITRDGETQPWSVGYSVSLWDIVKNNFGHVTSKKLWQQEVPNEVDWVSGAALAISKKLFDTCNGFDENFFMYFEDIDLCRRVQLRGQKILRLPQVSILHIGGQSYCDEKKQKAQYYVSQDYYFKKHTGVISLFFLTLLRRLALLF